MRTSNADRDFVHSDFAGRRPDRGSPKRKDTLGTSLHRCSDAQWPGHGRYGYRRPPFGIRARLVDAECKHIADAEELVLRSDGGTRDLGYPATMLPDGSALIANYFNSKSDDGKQVYIAASVVAEDRNYLPTRRLGQYCTVLTTNTVGRSLLFF